jgi:ABC-type sugar transport system substrate-binding protein
VFSARRTVKKKRKEEKVMKKAVVLVLVTSLILGMFGACAPANSGTQTSAPSNETAVVSENAATVAEEKVKIGYIGWSLTDDESKNYVRLLDNAAAACGYEMQYAVYSSVEDIMNQAQTLIQAGCKGLIVLVASPELIKLCDKNGVYLMQYASKVNDAAVLATLEESKFWAGVSYTENGAAGSTILKDMYDTGCRNVLVVAPPSGILVHDDRVNGIKQEAEKYGDLKLTIWRASDNQGKEVGDAVANYLNTDSSIAGIISTSGGDGANDTIVQSIDQAGKMGSIKFATFDATDNMAQYLQEGSAYAVAGNSLQSIVFCAITLNNLVSGSTWSYPVAIPSAWIWMHSIDEFNDFSKYICGPDTCVFSDADYQSVSYTSNPNANLEDLYKMSGLSTVADYKGWVQK